MGRALPLFSGLPTVPAFAWVRDPLDRLASCFWFFRNSQHHWYDWDARLAWRNLVDQVLAETAAIAAPHWVPQAELLEGYLDLTVFRFEELRERWAEIGFPPLPHLNGIARGADVDLGYRRAELLEYYAADLELRGA